MPARVPRNISDAELHPGQFQHFALVNQLIGGGAAQRHAKLPGEILERIVELVGFGRADNERAVRPAFLRLALPPM